MTKQWNICRSDPEIVQRITRELNCNPIIAQLLVNRRFVEREDIDSFLNPSFRMMRPPDRMADLSKAAERVAEALINDEKILIFSDYDVDGITSAILLLDFLGSLKADVTHYIPHRVQEGYGLKRRHITDFAKKKDFNLIITADCGSSSHRAVEVARQAGIDIIITDHHQIDEPFPDAHAIVNPKRKDCPSGLTYLAGVGVVFYLLIQLRKHLRGIKFWPSRQEPNLKKYCDLVALGTIADIVPLINENRILTQVGVEVMKAEERLGLNALIKQCRIDSSMIDADDIAFRICPRINAAGRLAHADTAIALLSATDPKQAGEISRQLEKINSARKDTVDVILAQIDNYLKAHPQMIYKRALVFAHHDWHIGVLGIVASKLVDKYYRPVVLLAVNNGVGIGSARSIKAFDLYQGLNECALLLERFGGHRMAAGLEIKHDNIHQFFSDFEKVVSKHLGAGDYIQTVDVDAELSFDQISQNLLDELMVLHPFGQGNPEPLFISKRVGVHFSKVIGNRHRRLVLYQDENRLKNKIQAIHFNVDEASLNKRYFDEVVYRLRPNYWKGGKGLQMVIEACR